MYPGWIRWQRWLRRSGAHLIRTPAAMIAAILCGAVGCTDHSTEPQPESYSLIVVDRGISRSVYFIDPDSKLVVDSIPRVGLVSEAAASPDGQSLYLYTLYEGGDPAGLYKYDLRSKVQAAFLPIFGGIVLTEGGRTIVTSDHDSLYIIATDVFQIRDTRPAPLFDTYGRLDADIVVGNAPSTPPDVSKTLAAYNFVTGHLDTVTMSDFFRVGRCFLHPDQRRVFVVGFRGYAARLFVVDLSLRESTEIQELQSSESRVLFSSTGDTAYVIHSDHLDNPELIGCGRGKISCLSTSEGQYSVLTTIETAAPLLSIALSPAGDRLYVGQSLNLCGEGGNVLVYDTGDLTSAPDTIPLPRKQSGPIEMLVVP
jgi:DNA-binding beta-propeller fold protein YncE